jgi:hypothetical protein
MKTRTLTLFPVVVLLTQLMTACSGTASSGNEKTIKSSTSGGLTITLSNSAGELKSGGTDLTLTFADSSGKPVNIGAASLKFHMPAMGSMPEMNNIATLTTTTTPGKYRARVNIEMAGTWEAELNYQGSNGAGQASMTVVVK